MDDCCRLSVSVSGFVVGFGLAHTPLVVVSGGFGMFQDVPGSAVNDQYQPASRFWCTIARDLNELHMKTINYTKNKTDLDSMHSGYFHRPFCFCDRF